MFTINRTSPGLNKNIFQYTLCHQPVMSDLGTKVGQIGPKWDKSGIFSDQISEHFGSPQKSRIWPVLVQSDPLLAQICPDCCELWTVNFELWTLNCELNYYVDRKAYHKQIMITKHWLPWKWTTEMTFLMMYINKGIILIWLFKNFFI